MMRPLLAVASVAVVLVLMAGSLTAGYQWGHFGRQSAIDTATAALARQLTLAELAQATHDEVEHGRAVRDPLVFSDPYRARVSYSPARPVGVPSEIGATS